MKKVPDDVTVVAMRFETSKFQENLAPQDLLAILIEKLPESDPLRLAVLQGKQTEYVIDSIDTQAGLLKLKIFGNLEKQIHQAYPDIPRVQAFTLEFEAPQRSCWSRFKGLFRRQEERDDLTLEDIETILAAFNALREDDNGNHQAESVGVLNLLTQDIAAVKQGEMPVHSYQQYHDLLKFDTDPTLTLQERLTPEMTLIAIFPQIRLMNEFKQFITKTPHHPATQAMVEIMVRIVRTQEKVTQDEACSAAQKFLSFLHNTPYEHLLSKTFDSE